MTDTTPLIVMVINRYYPDWRPPRDTGRAWMKTLCPFHAESIPSASISFERGAFQCFACGVKGDAISLIRREEEVNYTEAKRIAEELSPGGSPPVQRRPSRKSSRRVFGDKGVDGAVGSGSSRPVQARIRGRPTPWS